MTDYHRMYRVGLTPWEGYRQAAAASIDALLDREQVDRTGPLGRALDVGCVQGFDAEQRRAQGRGVTALANPGATLLMLAFGPTRLRRFIGGVSEAEVTDAFERWELLAVDDAIIAGLGWPMNRTSPRWYRGRIASSRPSARRQAAGRGGA